MRYIHISEHGGPEVMEIKEGEVPDPGSGDVLIRVDVILDMVGGDYVARNLELAAKDGRIVSLAFIKGSRVEIDMLPVLLKRLTVAG